MYKILQALRLATMPKQPALTTTPVLEKRIESRHSERLTRDLVHSERQDSPSPNHSLAFGKVLFEGWVGWRFSGPDEPRPSFPLPNSSKPNNTDSQ